MIVGVDVREWQPRARTGIGRFLEEFLREALVQRADIRFVLLGDPACEQRVAAERVTLVRHPEPWTPWWDQVTLPRLLARHGAQVLFSPYIKIPLWSPVPAVSTCHDLTFFLRPDYNRGPRDRILNRPFRLFSRWVARRAAAILVDSETSARDVQRLLGADPAKLRVVPLATGAAFRPAADPGADAPVLARYGIAPGYLLYVGGFSPHKNVPRLLRAHAALPAPLRARHPLVLVGGSVSPEVAAAVAAAADGSVRTVGLVPDPDLPALYRGAALFAFPSHSEGFGLPVLEAMACGIPVCCSTAPALRELTGTAAAHAAADDPAAWEALLHDLLTDEARRAELAARGLARSAHYRADRMAAAILALLAEVVRCRS